VPVAVFRQHRRPESAEPFDLRVHVVSVDIEMHTVFRHFRLWNEREEQSRATVRRFHQDRRVVFRIVDPAGTRNRINP
jgi:hypothetical protein